MTASAARETGLPVDAVAGGAYDRRHGGRSGGSVLERRGGSWRLKRGFQPRTGAAVAPAARAPAADDAGVAADGAGDGTGGGRLHLPAVRDARAWRPQADVQHRCRASFSSRSISRSRKPRSPPRSAFPPCCSSVSQRPRIGLARRTSRRTASWRRPCARSSRRCRSWPAITDVCLCEYTDHGHCGGVLNAGGEERPNRRLPEGYVLNDETLDVLDSRRGLAHADAGADLVAPSGMILDGMVRSIRTALDEADLGHVGILLYSVKDAFGFYGPFREAARSGRPSSGPSRDLSDGPGERARSAA